MKTSDLALPQTETKRDLAWLDFAGIAFRWVLGALFIYMGLSKALDPASFLKLLRQYELTNNYLILNSLAAGLPWFEIFCGVVLVLGVAVRGTSLLLLVMLAAFTAAVFQRAATLSQLQHIAFCTIRFDCGCGGGEVLICRKLAENTGLMLLCCGLLFGLGRRAALRFAIFRTEH